MLTLIRLLFLVLATTLGLTQLARAQDLTPDEARSIAAEAWLYAYAPIQGYQTMYNQTINTAFPGYVGGVNRFRHYSRAATPADTDIVTPNNDTPYSWAWLDLRAEPMVLSLPAVPAPRYYVNQWFDLYTHNFAYTGARTTGREAGNYLFAGPNWDGTVPEGITQVFRAETSPSGEIGSRSVVGSLERDLMYSAIERVDDERVVWGGSRSFLLCNEGILADGPPKLGVWHLLGPQCAYTGSALPPTGHARQIMPLGEGRALIRYESPSALLVVEVEGTRASCFDDTLSRRLRPTREALRHVGSVGAAEFPQAADALRNLEHTFDPALAVAIHSGRRDPKCRRGVFCDRWTRFLQPTRVALASRAL
jgi:hypothetical protein